MGEVLTPDGKPVLRDEKGHFLPGHAPRGGRPRGLTRSERIRAAIEPFEKELVDTLLRVALQGDGNEQVRALEAALSRITPPPRQESERVTVPGFADAPDLQTKAEAVIAAAATGHVSVEAAERLLRVLEIYAKAIVTTDLEKRLAALETGKARPSEVEDIVVGEFDAEGLV